MLKLVVLAGSIRNNSTNKLLSMNLIELNRDLADFHFIDLKDFQMPLYNGDYEEENHAPEKAKELFEVLKSADGIIISSPEYNSGITALLKNTIDWLTRVEQGNPYAVFKGKPMLLISAAAGGLGGLRSLYQLREILSNIFALVFPEMFNLAESFKAFDDKGKLISEEQKTRLKQITGNYIKFASKI